MEEVTKGKEARQRYGLWKYVGEERDLNLEGRGIGLIKRKVGENLGIKHLG